MENQGLSFVQYPLQQPAEPQSQDQQDLIEEDDEEDSEIECEVWTCYEYVHDIIVTLYQQFQELTVLTSSAAVPLRTARIQQVQVLPEYPRTLPSGYTYCVSTDKTQIEEVLQEALAVRNISSTYSGHLLITSSFNTAGRTKLRRKEQPACTSTAKPCAGNTNALEQSIANILRTAYEHAHIVMQMQNSGRSFVSIDEPL